MLGQYYQEEDYTAVNLPEGDYLATITDAREETAKSSGNTMAVLTLAIKEAQIVFKYRIVENEYFNKNMTRMFDCFKILRGNFNMRSWVGKVGFVHIAKGKPNDEGKQFLEVKTLVVASGTGQQRQGASQAAQQRPPVQNRSAQSTYTQQQNPQPAQTRVQRYEQEYDQQESQYDGGGAFPEDIPF